MEIRLQKAVVTLVLVAGFVSLVGCDAGGSTVPYSYNSQTPGTSTNTPTPAPAPKPTPAPTPAPTPSPQPVSGGGPGGTVTATGGVCGTGTTARCVSWAAPTTRMDGTNVSIADVAGYIIRYGSSATVLPNKIVLTDRYVTEYTLAQLAAGTYYITVSAYDAGNVESPTSAVLVRSF